MQLTAESPGLRPAAEYSEALPPSLSPIETVPVANELPVFDVVCEKDEKAPTAATPATRPAITRVRLIFRIVVTLLPFQALNALSAATGAGLSAGRGRQMRRISNAPSASAGTTTSRMRPSGVAAVTVR